jgi:hypothetical protein
VFTDRGVTYDFAGEERPFPLDLIPRVIDAVEWDLVARGVRQRVKALEAFLADVYGAGRVFADGVMPWRLIYTSPRPLPPRPAPGSGPAPSSAPNASTSATRSSTRTRPETRPLGSPAPATWSPAGLMRPVPGLALTGSMLH